MKAKKAAKQIKMTDSEIQEAIRRDKEWMDDVSSDEGIEVPKGALEDLFDGESGEIPDSPELGINAEDLLEEKDDFEVGDVEEFKCDAGGGDMKVSGVGGVLGAIVGGVVLGGILGAVLLDD